MGWIESTDVAMLISQSRGWFPALEMIHVAATTFVFGMIAVVDLRLLGLLARGSAISDLCRDVIPLTWAAFVVAAITGGLMFMSQAVAYSVNFAFQMKLAVLALIALNMLGFRLFVYPGISKWDRSAVIPLRARLAGALSLVGWIAVVSSGRWIAYLMI
jgi:CBS domain containing-hemolysin-like protein